MMAARFGHRMPWGAEVVDGGARFRVLAPAQERLALVVADTDQTLPMRQVGDGWFELVTDAVKVGRGYGFDLADGRFVPDPAARAQMGDVHGFSRLVDPDAYRWQTAAWKGRPWREAVIYELHTGTFSTEGTFDGVARDLDRLGSLGITVIELLPVAQFGGGRGWGYDGVLLYAPHIAYGGPEGLKRLVDAAHERELMMLLDVVYNHFGPDGNYLALYAPDFFDPKRKTPWGSAIDFHQRPVREFFLHNALYWLEEFRFDGLRLDAIDKIEDAADEPILAEMAREVRNRFPDRHVHLTIEDDDNSTRLLKFDADNRPRLFDAEWNDDWHHAMHALLTGERDGYYQDYADAPARRVAETMAFGFGYQGAPSAYRGGKRRREPSEHLPPTAFIDFLQNHDQVGNRADGKRLDGLIAPEAVEAGLALLLLSPHIPLLFMGEEYGDQAGFYFFTDFQGELAEAVRKGRNEEFHTNKAFTEAFSRDLVPDPNAFETFAASKLDPTRTSHGAEAVTRARFVKRLLEVRFAHIVPKLAAVGGHAGKVEAVQNDALVVSWLLDGGSLLTLFANLGDRETRICAEPAGAIVFAHPPAAKSALAQHSLPAWSVIAVMGYQS
jgi:maltooligosyltrehalose trehalohydrolase